MSFLYFFRKILKLLAWLFLLQSLPFQALQFLPSLPVRFFLSQALLQELFPLQQVFVFLDLPVLLLLPVAHAQAVATLGATASQYLAAIGSSHAVAETVLVSFLSV